MTALACISVTVIGAVGAAAEAGVSAPVIVVIAVFGLGLVVATAAYGLLAALIDRPPRD